MTWGTLQNALTDLYGEVSGVDAQKLLGTVRNYADNQMIETPGNEGAVIYALCDYSGISEAIKEFQNACKKFGIVCKLIRWGDNRFGQLKEIIRAGHPVFIYFSDVRIVQSNYYENQIQSIIYNDLGRNIERRLYILWENEDVHKAYSERFSYFNHIQGNVKGDRGMEDIVTELKECMGV